MKISTLIPLLPTLLLIGLIGLGVFGCQQDEPTVDVSHIHPNFSLLRLDSLLHHTDTTDINSLVDSLEKKHPEFSRLYFDYILGLANTPDAASRKSFLKAFKTDTLIRNLSDTVHLLYHNLEAVKTDLAAFNQHYHYYFPERHKLKYFTIYSEFSIGNFLFAINDSTDGVGIGLDFFLGSDFPYKQKIPNNPTFSDYLTRSFNKEHLVKKTAEVLVEDLVGAPSDNRFLDHIIRNGKKLYILSRLLPQTPDSVLFEYTTEQLNWCNSNEKQLWSHFLVEDLLYSTKMMDFRKLIGPSPNSPGMPAEAPGQTGNFIGYKIIQALMKRENNLSLKDLVTLTNAQEILDRSKYKP